MFKKVLLLIFLIFLVSNVFSMRLVEPFSRELSDNDFVGSIVPGQSLELIFSKEFGRFESLEIVSFPSKNFSVSVIDSAESVKVIIDSDEKALITNHFFTVAMDGSSERIERELFFSVDDSLLEASLLNFYSVTNVSERASYEFLLVNKSHADALFKVKINVPWYWLGDDFFGKEYYSEVLVPKQSKQREVVNVFPRVQGTHYFDSEIILHTSTSSKKFSIEAFVEPTLVSKFGSSFYGLPFYSLSLYPSYFFMGLLAHLF